jgi:formate dehydrogenase iron-sulfur subunit
MGAKSFFIDTTKCTACRGCQVACKQWNELPAEKTSNRGTYQNPPDLSSQTYTLVRFNEVSDDGKVKWYFFKDQCRHCISPPCLIEADNEKVSGAITQDETGAVLYDPQKTKQLNFAKIKESCPYNIPRVNSKTKSIAKCTMCVDRVTNGLLPACVKACPTGTMQFGEREEMLKKAHERLDQLKPLYKDARILDEEEVSVLYLIVDKPSLYQIAERNDSASLLAFKSLFKPLSVLGVGAALLCQIPSLRQRGLKKD